MDVVVGARRKVSQLGGGFKYCSILNLASGYPKTDAVPLIAVQAAVEPTETMQEVPWRGAG